MGLLTVAREVIVSPTRRFGRGALQRTLRRRNYLMKLRTIGMAAVAALALVAGRAEAQDAGWDTKYGILFTLPNPFGGNATATASSTTGASTAFAVGGSNTGWLNSFNGMVGGQYNLTPTTALRLGLNLSRTSTGITENTDAAGLKQKVLPTWTSQYGLALEGQYLLRLATAAVAPYVGAGGVIGFNQDNRVGDSQATFGGPVTKIDDYRRTWGASAIGTAGLEWRIHKVIALFVEYRGELKLFSSASSENKATPAGGAQSTTKAVEAHFLNLSTGIANSGQIGILALF
jgi:outer membrane protein W